MLDDVLGALPGRGAYPAGLRADVKRLVELSRQLTKIEVELGVDVYGPQAFAYRGTSPRTHWEAAHQGYAVAEDERRRLDLGSAPIRDSPGDPGHLVRCGSRAWRCRSPPPACTSTPRKQGRWSSSIGAPARRSGDSGWSTGLPICSSSPSAAAHLPQGRDGPSPRGCAPMPSRAGFSCPRGEWSAISIRLAGTPWRRASGACWRSSPTGPRAPRTSHGSAVSGRSRRVDRGFNAFELSQVAGYFGVTRSLVAHVLRNLRFLSDDARDRLTDGADEGESDRALHAVGRLEGRAGTRARCLRVAPARAGRRGPASRHALGRSSQADRRAAGSERRARARLLGPLDSGSPGDRDTGRNRRSEVFDQESAGP